MKRIIFALLIFTMAANAQQVVRPSTSFYSADSVKNRTDLTRALMDGVLKWKDSGFVEMEIPVYQPTLFLRFPKISGQTIVIKDIDTVVVGSELTKSYKDTLVKGWSRIRLNKLKRIVFTETGTKDSYNLKVLDSTIFEPCSTGDFCKKDTLTFKVRKFYEGKYMVDVQEISDFKIPFFFERDQDSNETRTQTYGTSEWSLYRRSGETIDELLGSSFDFVSDTPGNGSGDPGTEDYTGVLYRHTQKFTKKYYQIKAVENKTGFEVLLDIQNNEFK